MDSNVPSYQYDYVMPRHPQFGLRCGIGTWGFEEQEVQKSQGQFSNEISCYP